MAEKPGKRQQRADRNRKRLLGAAMKVFSQKGYHKATLDEICRQANLGKGTVYQHFGNKKGLFLGLADSRLTELGRHVAEAVQKNSDALGQLRAAISAYVQFFAADRRFYRILTHEQSSFGKEIGERFRTRCFTPIEVLVDVLQTGMKGGKVKKLDPRSAAFALVGMCNLTLYRWLMSDKPYPLDKEIRLIAEIFLTGISRVPTARGA